MNRVKLRFWACTCAAAANLAALAVFLTISGASPATAQTIIDDFQQNQSTLTGTGSATQVGSMIGGERDLALSVSNGAISVGVSLGVLRVSGDAAANGSVEVVWDGIDNDATTLANNGLGGTNLAIGGDNAFLVGINSLSGAATLTLTVFSGATSSSVALSGLTPSPLPQMVRVPYSAFTGAATFSSIGAIRLQISSLADANVELDFLRTGSASGPAPVEALLTDVVLIDNDGNGKASAGDKLKYVVTIKNNSGSALTNVQLNLPAIGNTTLDGASVTLTPLARDDGPAGASSPGDNFHTPFNTALNVADGSAQDLLSNDFAGAPAAVISRFGGGTLGGAVDDHNAGTAADSGGHSLTVNSDGSFSYAPASGFAGLFTFRYRLANAAGSSTATATIAVGVRPAASPDSFAVTGNTLLDSSLVPQSVLGNDTGDALAIIANTSPANGTLSLNPNGNFTYSPNAGFTGTDSFSYTIANGFGSKLATVTLTVTNRVWFIDSASVAAGADGRSASPYKTLAAFTTANDGAAGHPADNDLIFIRQGSGNYTGGTTLRAGQKLIGDGSSGTLNATFGIAFAPGSASAPGVALPAFVGIDPVIENTGAGDGILLNSSNTVRGLTVDNTPNGFGYRGTSVGSLTILECTKSGTGGAVDFTQGSGSVNVSFDSLSSTNAPAEAVNLVNVSGAITAASGAVDAPVGAAIKISGGTVGLTYPGSLTKNNAGRLVEITGKTGGTVTLSGSWSQTSSSGTGINIANNGASTVNLTGTSKVLNTSGNIAVTIATNNGTSINFNNGGLNINTTSATAFSVNGGGSVAVRGTGNTVNSTTGTAFSNADTGASSANIDINASLVSTTGRLILIQGRSGSPVLLSGNLTNAGTGILVQNNSGSTVTFSGTSKILSTAGNPAVTVLNHSSSVRFTGGGLAITTTSGAGLSATGVSDFIVTGASNTISTTSGTALNVVNSTIGVSGLTFLSISSVGGSSTGIILDTTGASGGLTITGAGTAGSGGTIANKTGSDGSTTTGIGIYLNNTRNVSLRRMQLNDFENHGIRGFGVTNFTLLNSVVNGINGNDPAFDNYGEGCVYFGDDASAAMTGLSGSCVIGSCTFSGGRGRNVSVVNTAGALNRLTITNCTFGLTQSPEDSGSSLAVEARNAGTVANVTVLNNVFSGAAADLGNFTGQTGTSMDVIFQGNTCANTHPNNVVGGGGLTLATQGTYTFNVSSNSFRDADGSAISLFKASSGTNLSGVIRSNTIGVSGVADSGSKSGNGIFLSSSGSGTISLTIDNNNIRGYSGNAGIYLDNTDGIYALNLNVTGNTTAEPGPAAFAGLALAAGAPSTTDAIPVCANITGNNFSAGDPSNSNDVIVGVSTGGSSIRLPGYSGSTLADVQNFILGNNNVAGTTVNAYVDAPATAASFVGGAACVTPP
jgi:hypothetical protein